MLLEGKLAVVVGGGDTVGHDRNVEPLRLRPAVGLDVARVPRPGQRITVNLLVAVGAVTDRGAVDAVPGLYFVGLHFLYALSSATLIGVSRDARHVVRAVEARVRSVRSEGIPAGIAGAGGAAAA